MKYQEDFVLEKKYLNLIEKHIYNTKTDKFGMITGIEITSFGIQLKAYYDNIDSDSIVFFEDFEKNVLKFVIVTETGFSKSITENYKKEIIEDVKSFFENKFTEDMIMYVKEEKRDEKNRENKQKEIKNISGKLMNLSKLSAEIFHDNYAALKLYKKYTEGVLTETELLYAVCNYLCEEVKKLKDWNLDLSMKDFLKEEAEFLVDYAESRFEKQEKIINEENKEGMFKIMDMLLGKERKAEE